jgi:hypothetical protein
MSRRLIKGPTDAGFAVCSPGILTICAQATNCDSWVLACQMDKVYYLYLNCIDN